ncbi:hypothetical protein STEG23_022940, partial [Scotinomys teguina]
CAFRYNGLSFVYLIYLLLIPLFSEPTKTTMQETQIKIEDGKGNFILLAKCVEISPNFTPDTKHTLGAGTFDAYFLKKRMSMVFVMVTTIKLTGPKIAYKTNL